MNENEILTMVFTFIITLIGSSSFWVYLQKRFDRNSATNKMLLGLAHYRIMANCSKYLKRGEITRDEYEDLYNYLYLPYLELGGNGTATRLMNDVQKLPIRFNYDERKGEAFNE